MKGVGHVRETHSISRTTFHPDVVIKGIQITQCKESNAVSSKIGAIIILRGVLGRSVHPEDIPNAEEPIVSETVIAATHVKASGDVVVEPDVATPKMKKL